MSLLTASTKEVKYSTFNVKEENDQYNLEGELIITVSNNGPIPARNVSGTVEGVVIGPSIKILENKKVEVGRIGSLSSADIKLQFSSSTSDQENFNTVQALCEEGSVQSSIKGSLSGSIFSTSINDSGKYSIDQYSCDIEQSDGGNQQPNPPEDTDPEPPSDEPSDGTQIAGPSEVSVGSSETYSWSDFPEETQRLEWNMYSNSNDVEDGDATLELVDGGRDRIMLEFSSAVAADFLIEIVAISGGEPIEVAEKEVSVV